MKQSDFPEWALKIKTQERGTILKKVGKGIYLYKCTSKRVKDRKYPVVEEHYLGLVTENGLVRAEGFLFYPLDTEISTIAKEFSIESLPEDDKELLARILIVRNKDGWFLPKLSKSDQEIIQKYFDIDAGQLKKR
ncbi:MAG: hypothetical protein IJ719_15225 [Clostridia bacterium]|nr:hypothetical protein [Clostridia bacterium]